MFRCGQAQGDKDTHQGIDKIAMKGSESRVQHLPGRRKQPQVAIFNGWNSTAQFEITCDSSREAVASRDTGLCCERSVLLTLVAMLRAALLCPASLTPSMLGSPR